jgi:hypothetical protein
MFSKISCHLFLCVGNLVVMFQNTRFPTANHFIEIYPNKRQSASYFSSVFQYPSLAFSRVMSSTYRPFCLELLHAHVDSDVLMGPAKLASDKNMVEGFALLVTVTLVRPNFTATVLGPETFAAN